MAGGLNCSGVRSPASRSKRNNRSGPLAPSLHRPSEHRGLHEENGDVSSEWPRSKLRE